MNKEKLEEAAEKYASNMSGLDKNGMIKPCPYDKDNISRCCKPNWVKEKCSCYLRPKSDSRNSILYL